MRIYEIINVPYSKISADTPLSKRSLKISLLFVIFLLLTNNGYAQYVNNSKAKYIKKHRISKIIALDSNRYNKELSFYYDKKGRVVQFRDSSYAFTDSTNTNIYNLYVYNFDTIGRVIEIYSYRLTIVNAIEFRRDTDYYITGITYGENDTIKSFFHKVVHSSNEYIETKGIPVLYPISNVTTLKNGIISEYNIHHDRIEPIKSYEPPQYPSFERKNILKRRIMPCLQNSFPCNEYYWKDHPVGMILAKEFYLPIDNKSMFRFMKSFNSFAVSYFK